MTVGVPQGTATILFTDIVESTALTERLGDAAFRAAARDLDERLRAAIRQEEGVPVEGTLLGDGVMALFTSASRAIAAGRRCIDASAETTLRLHVGLHAGDVIREADNAYGGAVNIAARVRDLAAAGELLVSATVRELARTSAGVLFDDRGEHTLRGISEAVRVYAIRWEDDDRSAAPPTDRPRFVGRKQELGVLMEALADARAGRGAVVLICGEAGVGKTRLAEECMRAAHAAGVLTATGTSFEDSGVAPYAPFVQLIEGVATALPADALRAALGEDAPALSQLAPSVARDHAFRAQSASSMRVDARSFSAPLHDFFARAGHHAPLLLLLDDLQWADPASIQALRVLARDAREHPLLVIGTYRDAAPDAEHMLAQAVDELHTRRLAAEIELKPFGVEAVAEMLREASGRDVPVAVARALQAETGGNPFFLEELYRHLAEEGELFDSSGAWRPTVKADPRTLPRSIRLVLGRRLARLGERTRRTLAAAAVLGTTFDPALLELIAEANRDELLDSLDEAERAHMIVCEDRGSEEQYRFAHPLIRTVIMAELSSSRRQRLNMRTAQAIESRGATEPALDSQLAHHYRAAGRLADPARAVAAMCVAADHALAAYANVDAASHLDHALRIAERSSIGSAAMARLHHLRGQAQYRLGEWEHSRASLERALDLYRTAGNAHAQARVLHSLGSLATFRSRPAEALTVLAQAHDLAPGDDALNGVVLQLEAQNLVDLRQYEAAERAVAEAAALAERLDDAYMRNHARIASGYLALTTLDLARAVDMFRLVSGASVALPHERMAAESRRAIALACLGALDEADERSAVARQYFTNMQDTNAPLAPEPDRDPYEFGLSCVAEGMSAIARGRFTHTLAFLQDAIDCCGEPPNERVMRTLAPMGVQALYSLGRYDEAQAWLERLVPTGGERRPAFARLLESLIAAARGGESEHRAQAIAPPAREPDMRSIAVVALAAEAGIATRDAQAARAQIDGLESLHRRNVVFTSGWVAFVPRLLGAAHALAGNELRASPLLDEALATARARGAKAEIALTCLEIAELALMRDDIPKARSALAEAKSGFSALGMAPASTRTAALSAALLETRARVSEDEADMLRLIAAGLSNREIAARRSITERAVQRKLTALYGTIGVANRVAAIAYAFRHEIIQKDA